MPSRSIGAELEFWLETFLHTINSLGQKAAQPLPQLNIITATHPTNNSQSEALQNHAKPPKNHCKPHTPPHSITTELEFHHDPT